MMDYHAHYILKTVKPGVATQASKHTYQLEAVKPERSKYEKNSKVVQVLGCCSWTVFAIQMVYLHNTVYFAYHDHFGTK